MAPQPRPSTSSFLGSLRKPFLLTPFFLPLLLLVLSLRPVACTGGGDNADAASTHETLSEAHSSPPAAPPPPPLHRTPSSSYPPSLSSSGVGSVSGGDRNHSPRAAADGNGLIKGLDDDDWGGPWGQRRRRGQGSGGDDDGLVSMPPRQSCKDLRSKRIISDGFCTSTRPLTEAVCAEKCCGPTPSPNRQRPRGGGGYRPHKYRPHQPSSPISLQRSSSLRPPWYADYVKVWARGQNEMNSVTARVSGMADDGDEDGEDGGDAGTDEGGEEGTGNAAVEWKCVEDAVRRRRVRLLCRDGTRRTYHVRLVKSCKCVQRRRRKRRRGRRKGRRRLGRLGGLAGRRFIRE